MVFLFVDKNSTKILEARDDTLTLTTSIINFDEVEEIYILSPVFGHNSKRIVVYYSNGNNIHYNFKIEKCKNEVNFLTDIFTNERISPLIKNHKKTRFLLRVLFSLNSNFEIYNRSLIFEDGNLKIMPFAREIRFYINDYFYSIIDIFDSEEIFESLLKKIKIKLGIFSKELRRLLFFYSRKRKFSSFVISRIFLPKFTSLK